MRGKQLWAALCAAALALLCGCSITPEAEKAVDRMLNALQNGNIRAAEAHTVEGTLNINRTGRNAEKVYNPLFASIVHNVTGSDSSRSDATVTVTLLVLDMEELTNRVTAELLREVMENNLSDRQASDRYYALLLESMEADDAPTIGYTVGVRVVRENNRWRVSLADSPEFIEAITGGLPAMLGY